MNRIFFKQPWRPVLMTGLLVFLSACASTSGDKQDIGERAQARWDALLSGDFQSAYSYLTPGTRSGISVIDYQRGILLQRVHWTGAEYLQSDCLETTCKVSISLGYKIAGALPGVRVYEGNKTTTEDWIKTDGQWWYVLKK